jgi:hypothetical protein
MSNARLNLLVKDNKIPLEHIINPMRMKWSKENSNHVRTKSEIPDYILTATLTELFATSPFSYGGAL